MFLRNNVVNIFFSYSHIDDELLEELHKFFKPLEDKGEVLFLYDKKILPGNLILKDIASMMNVSDIICLTMSQNTLASSACIDERKKALQLAKNKNVKIIPIIFSNCTWLDEEDVKELMALPTDGKPMNQFVKFEDACMDVYKGIMKVIESLSILNNQEILKKGIIGNSNEKSSLKMTPRQRFENILVDVEHWHIDVGNEENAYYESAPEYQILFSDLEEGEECYSYFFCNEKAFFGTAEFKYHSTTLFKLQYGTVDEMRIYIAIPQIAGFSAKRIYFYYYFIKGSVLHKFHELVCGDGLKFSRAGNRYNPFLVFDSEEDRKGFDKYLKSIPNLEQKIESHEYGNYLFKRKNHPNMRFLAFAIDAYKEWNK